MTKAPSNNDCDDWFLWLTENDMSPDHIAEQIADRLITQYERGKRDGMEHKRRIDRKISGNTYAEDWGSEI